MTTLNFGWKETLPSPLAGPGVLHLRCLMPHTRHKIMAYLQASTHSFTEGDRTLSVCAPEADLTSLVLPLTEVLSPLEQADVRVIFQPDGRSWELDDFFEVDTLHNFLCKTLCGWLIDLMQHDRLTTVFQPIVQTHSRAVFGYECLLRTVEGDRVIYPNRILDVARGAGLLFQLDLAARRTAIREAARFGLDGKIFINFTPTAIYDPAYGLRSTVEAVDELGLRREQIVFEVIESELIRDVAHLKAVLDDYRSCGFGVALDDLGSGYSSLNLLGQLRPDYVKLDRELMHGVQDDAYKALIAQKLLETAHALNLRTVAEGIESAHEYEWLRERDADYAQGFYFARPASPPPLR